MLVFRCKVPFYSIYWITGSPRYKLFLLSLPPKHLDSGTRTNFHLGKLTNKDPGAAQFYFCSQLSIVLADLKKQKNNKVIVLLLVILVTKNKYIYSHSCCCFTLSWECFMGWAHTQEWLQPFTLPILKKKSALKISVGVLVKKWMHESKVLHSWICVLFKLPFFKTLYKTVCYVEYEQQQKYILLIAVTKN